MKDFGVHCKKYYPLKVEYFKSAKDEEILQELWSKYWVQTLSASPLVSAKEHSIKMISDLTSKLNETENVSEQGYA